MDVDGPDVEARLHRPMFRSSSCSSSLDLYTMRTRNCLSTAEISGGHFPVQLSEILWKLDSSFTLNLHKLLLKEFQVQNYYNSFSKGTDNGLQLGLVFHQIFGETPHAVNIFHHPQSHHSFISSFLIYSSIVVDLPHCAAEAGPPAPGRRLKNPWPHSCHHRLGKIS